MANELDELFVDGNEIDKKLVAEILSRYIRIDKTTFEIRPLPAWNSLKENTKILLYLAARKAMIAHGLKIGEEPASNTEIINNTGLNKNTVNPALRRFIMEKILSQTKEQKYFIPNYAMETVKNRIIGKQ